jgi:hypothetical protein
MPRVGFELTIPGFERAKTVHALDHATIVIGSNNTCIFKIHFNTINRIIQIGKGKAIPVTDRGGP